MPLGRFESAHWQSGIERRRTATPGSILVEIHSSRMDASREVIEDGESIFIAIIANRQMFNELYPMKKIAKTTSILISNSR